MPRAQLPERRQKTRWLKRFFVFYKNFCIFAFAQLARHSDFHHGWIILFPGGSVCRVGGQIHTKTLLDVSLLTSNLAVEYFPEEDTATGNVHWWWRLSHPVFDVEHTLYHPWRGLAALLILLDGSQGLKSGWARVNSHVFLFITALIGSCEVQKKVVLMRELTIEKMSSHHAGLSMRRSTLCGSLTLALIGTLALTAVAPGLGVAACLATLGARAEICELVWNS